MIQYVLLGYAGVKLNGMMGFAFGGMISNVVQLTLVFALGLFLVKKTSDAGEE